MDAGLPLQQVPSAENEAQPKGTHAPHTRSHARTHVRTHTSCQDQQTRPHQLCIQRGEATWVPGAAVQNSLPLFRPLLSQKGGVWTWSPA